MQACFIQYITKSSWQHSPQHFLLWLFPTEAKNNLYSHIYILYIHVDTVLTENISFFPNTWTVRGGLRRTSILYWMQQGPWRIKKRLRFSMPSLLISLKVRPVIFRLLYLQTWKSEMGSRIKPPWFRWKQLETVTSPWGQMGTTQERWGSWQR